MPDHPSWPAELVEKAAIAIHDAAGADNMFSWRDSGGGTRGMRRRQALAVLSALSGDLVPREEHERLAGRALDLWMKSHPDEVVPRSQADALAEALERLMRAGAEHHPYDIGGWNEHPPNDDCDAFCELMRASREAQARLASYRSSSPPEGESRA